MDTSKSADTEEVRRYLPADAGSQRRVMSSLLRVILANSQGGGSGS